MPYRKTADAIRTITRAMRAHALVLSFIGTAVVCGMWATTTHAHVFSWVGGFSSNGEWWTPVDFWQPIPGTHAILWGAFPHLYDYIGGGYLNGYYNPPGLVFLYLPFTFLADTLGLTTPGIFSMVPGVHPTAWLVYGPVEIALAYSVLFPIEALVKRGTTSISTRRAVVVASALLLIPLTILYGHPEYSLALGCGIYGLIAGLDGKYRRMAWLFGAGLVFQPIVGLFAIPALGILSRREVLPALWRIAAVPIAFLAVPFIGSPMATWQAIAEQTAYPSVPTAETTPFTSLANHKWYEYGAKSVDSSGKPDSPAERALGIGEPTSKILGSSLTPAERRLPTAPGGFNYRIELARGSESRVLAFLGVGLLAVFLRRRRLRGRLEPAHVVWACALGLSLRPIFETANFPYYMVSGLLALLVVIAWRRSNGALLAALPPVLGVLVLGFFWDFAVYLHWPQLPAWLWWSLLVACTAILARLAWPRPSLEAPPLAGVLLSAAAVDADRRAPSQVSAAASLRRASTEISYTRRGHDLATSTNRGA